MKVIPFNHEHMSVIRLQERNKGFDVFDTVELFKELEMFESFTAIEEDGTILGCAGVVKMNINRAIAWSYLSEESKHKMFALTKAVKRFFEICGYNRIEMHVDCDFKEAHHWARMLGFEMECERMRQFSPDGRDCALYAKVGK